MGESKNRRRERAAENGVVLKQVGALPYRIDKAGNMEVMLITTRQTRRFTLPKGWGINGKSDREAARALRHGKRRALTERSPAKLLAVTSTGRGRIASLSRSG